jgi:hypothetical protein
MILAMRTASVTAGVRDISLLSTIVVGATDQHLRAVFLPALLHRLQSFFMAWQDRFTVFFKKTIFEFIDD